LQIPKVCICILGQRASNIISKRIAFAAFSGESSKLRSRGVVQGRMLMRPGKKNVHIDSYPRAIFAIVNGIASATNWLKGAQSNEYMIVGKKIMDRQIPKGFLRSLLERLQGIFSGAKLVSRREPCPLRIRACLSSTTTMFSDAAESGTITRRQDALISEGVVLASCCMVL
jgi:hypothetical protein